MILGGVFSVEPLVYQLHSFGATLLIGAASGLCYDYYRTLREALKLKRFGTNLGDLAFWLVTTGLVFYLLLLENSGEMRFYVLVGLGLGALVYFYFFSVYAVWLISMKFYIIKRAYLFVAKTFSILSVIALLPLRLSFLALEMASFYAEAALGAGAYLAGRAFYIVLGRRIEMAARRAGAKLSALAFWRAK